MIKLKESKGKFLLVYNKLKYPSPLTINDVVNFISGKERTTGYLRISAFFMSLAPKIKIIECREELAKQLRKCYNTEEKPKKKVIAKTLTIKRLDQLLKIVTNNLPERAQDAKLLLYVIVSIWFVENDVIFACIIAPPQTGKSTLLDIFQNSDEIVEVEDVSLEGLAPGTAKAEDEYKSLLDTAISKTILWHDATSILGSHETKIDRWFGIFTNAYGPKPYKKFSPGAGLQEYGKEFNLVVGITPHIFDKNKTRFTSNGRFLFYELPPTDDKEIILGRKDYPNILKINKAMLGFLDNLKTRFKKEKPKIVIPNEVIEEIYNFLNIYKYYKLIKKNKKGEYFYQPKRQPSGIKRRFAQIKMLMKAKCFIEERKTATIEDFNFFKKLFYGLDDAPIRARKLVNLKKFGDEKYKLFDAEIVLSKILESVKTEKSYRTPIEEPYLSYLGEEPKIEPPYFGEDPFESEPTPEPDPKEEYLAEQYKELKKEGVEENE